MTTSRIPLVVIGGGVIGCAVLRELARRGVPGVLVEAEPDVCEGTSKANSAIVHTGFDSKPGTIESRMLRRAAELWPATIDELDVPFLSVGALMLARTLGDASRLEREVAANAATLGVRTELLDSAASRDAAPYLAPDVVAALSIPDEAVVDPFWLTRAYAEAAIVGGAEVRLSTAVVGLEVRADSVVVRLSDGTELEAEQVVDAAGIHADEVAALAGDRSFAVSPRVGQFLVSEETFGVDRIVLPIPGALGKGMLVTPIVFGGLLLGPTAVDATDRDDRSTDPTSRERILAATRAMVPALADAVPVRGFAGIRHVSSTGDFVVRPSTAGDRLYLAAGIRSTGISTSPAVAEAIADDVSARRGWDRRPGVRLAPPPVALADEPGATVCVCRSIARAEVDSACRRPLAPRTLDAVKRRGGATFGDCQGNLCALDVASILAAERAADVASVEKHRPGSWLWEPANSSTLRPEPAASIQAPPADELDVVVVGAGRSGTAAAEAMRAGGLGVAVVERERALARGAARDGAIDGTVVGISPLDGRWLVLVQSEAGAVELRSRHVVVASGAYVEPREHRPIAGPRPSGVMTADLARRLLHAGLRPGRRVALVGDNAVADAVALDLEAAGSAVVRLEAPPEAVAGDARLTAVAGADGWVDADTLVLADRLLPQAFLLRGLGLVDGRPGSRPPVDDDGRLPLPGLWAVGCCVEPDWDHDRCAAAGRALAARIEAALERHSADREAVRR